MESSSVHVSAHRLDVVIVVVVVAVVVVVIVVVVDGVDDVGHGVDGDEEEGQQCKGGDPGRCWSRTFLLIKVPIRGY